MAVLKIIAQLDDVQSIAIGKVATVLEDSIVTILQEAASSDWTNNENS